LLDEVDSDSETSMDQASRSDLLQSRFMYEQASQTIAGVFGMTFDKYELEHLM